MNYEYKRRMGLDQGVPYDLRRLVRRMKPGDRLTVDSLAELALETGPILRFLQMLHALDIEIESRSNETTKRMIGKVAAKKMLEYRYHHGFFNSNAISPFIATRTVLIGVHGMEKMVSKTWNHTALAEMREMYRYWCEGKTIAKIGIIMRRRHRLSWRYLSATKRYSLVRQAIILYEQFRRIGIEPESVNPMSLLLSDLQGAASRSCLAFPLACAPSPTPCPSAIEKSGPPSPPSPPCEAGP